MVSVLKMQREENPKKTIIIEKYNETCNEVSLLIVTLFANII